MSKQRTFTEIEYGNRKRKSRREEFLEAMDKLVPWKEIEESIKPVYFSGERSYPQSLWPGEQPRAVAKPGRPMGGA